MKKSLRTLKFQQRKLEEKIDFYIIVYAFSSHRFLSRACMEKFGEECVYAFFCIPRVKNWDAQHLIWGGVIFFLPIEVFMLFGVMFQHSIWNITQNIFHPKEIVKNIRT